MAAPRDPATAETLAMLNAQAERVRGASPEDVVEVLLGALREMAPIIASKRIWTSTVTGALARAAAAAGLSSDAAWSLVDGGLERYVVRITHNVADLKDPDATATNRFRDALIVGAAIRDLPPPMPLIPGYLDRDSVAVLYGASQGGKTFVAFHWAMQLITSKWHLGDGFYTETGRVLYALAEGAAGMQWRLDAWEEHHGHKITDDFVWEPLPLGLYQASAQDVQDLLDAAIEVQPDLILVDTLAKNSVGAEENSNRDMGIVVDRLEALRRATGACVCAVHHTGKDSAAGMRGASSLLGNVDTTIRCDGAGGRITLTVEKDRNRETPRKTYFRTLKVGRSLVVVDDDRSAESDDLTDVDRSVLDALESVIVDGGVASTVWLKASGIADRSFYRSRSKLLRLGHVANLGTKDRPRYANAANCQTLPNAASGSTDQNAAHTAKTLWVGSGSNPGSEGSDCPTPIGESTVDRFSGAGA